MAACPQAHVGLARRPGGCGEPLQTSPQLVHLSSGAGSGERGWKEHLLLKPLRLTAGQQVSHGRQPQKAPLRQAPAFQGHPVLPTGEPVRLPEGLMSKEGPLWAHQAQRQGGGEPAGRDG